MEFRVLGPLEVTDGARPVRIRAAKHRILLATLLLRANRPVSIDYLAERLWGGDLPEQPRRAIQIYVVRLRKELGVPELIQAQSDGYLMRVGNAQLDMAEFGSLLREADLAHDTGDPRTELDLLTAATALWRGDPVQDVRSDVLHRIDVAPLVEEFVRAQERLADIRLRLGRHAEVIPDLQTLVANYPLRERLSAQLMIALYRAGRQAEALAVYRNVARLLAKNLGLDPGKELTRLHQMVLTGALSAAAPASSWVVQRQLPLDVPDFVGRADVIRPVEDMLTDRTTVPVVTISGPNGIGKSALAVRVAHRIAGKFPDGQWYVRFAGSPSRLLAELLMTTGVDARVMPDTVDGRAALLRARVAGRRILLCIDGAVDAAQVAPLLPGTPGSAVIVTSRQPLPELTVRFGARRIELDGIDLPDSIALLNRLLGACTDADVEMLAGRCGGSPLALRRAAAALLVDQRDHAGLGQVK